EARRTGGVARRVQGLEPDPGDLPGVAVGDLTIGPVAVIGHVPPDVVVRVEVHGGTADPVREIADHTHVGVMPVGEQAGLDLAGPDRLGDGVDAVGRVDDDDVRVIADDPYVVVHVEGLPVEGEGSGRDEMFDCSHQNSTTDLSTWPA